MIIWIVSRHAARFAADSNYVQYVNFVYKRRGTLWEGRFKSSLVDQEQYLLTCYWYIELNPVRANMVERSQDYRWSSYASHGMSKPDDLIEDHPLYVALGDTAKTRGAAYPCCSRQQSSRSKMPLWEKHLDCRIPPRNPLFITHQ